MQGRGGLSRGVAGPPERPAVDEPRRPLTAPKRKICESPQVDEVRRERAELSP